MTTAELMTLGSLVGRCLLPGLYELVGNHPVHPECSCSSRLFLKCLSHNTWNAFLHVPLSLEDWYHLLIVFQNNDIRENGNKSI